MTFTQVFGGTTIYPAGVSYRAIALSANQTLAWPVETATSSNVVAQIMDVTPSVGSLSILMPPANEASPGETALFFNAGSFTFTVKDNGGNTITTVAPGLSYQVYMTGNSTVNGTWRSTQYSAGTSSATAGTLVGSGIKAISTTLNQSMSVTTLNSNYAIGDADRSEAFVWTGGAGTFTLPVASTVGNDWFCNIRNSGTGSVALNTSSGELINGASSLSFNPGDSAIVICDGSAFFTIGLGQSAAFSFDYVSIDLTSQASPYTLSGANLNRIAYSFGGTLTANMVVNIPPTIQQYWIANNTSGSFTLTVKVAGQTGVIVNQGARGIYYCNGTDIVDADTAGITFPLTVAQGGTNSTTPSGARVNLGATSVGNAVFTAATAADGRTALSAAASGANSDITSLTGLTTPLSVPQGGTGVATLTSGYLAKGNGASAVSSSLIYDTGTNIGIGTSTPGSKFTVAGIIESTTGGIKYPDGTIQTTTASGLIDLISTTTASGATTVDFTGLSSTYSEYFLVVRNLILVASASISVRTSTDNGVTFDSTVGNYSYQNLLSSTTTASGVTNTSAASILVAGTTMGSASGNYMELRLVNAGVSAYASMAYMISGATNTFSTGIGFRLSATAVNALRILTNSTNTISGVFKLYGVKA